MTETEVFIRSTRRRQRGSLSERLLWQHWRVQQMTAINITQLYIFQQVTDTQSDKMLESSVI